MDSFKTFNVDETKLVTILEQVINFEELKPINFNIHNIVGSQCWWNYFEMLPGPVFPSFVKRFWMNASVYFNDENVEEIRYVVFNTPITITLSLIAYIIKYEEDGANIKWYISNLTIRKNILSITKSTRNPSKSFDPTLTTNLWY